MCSPLKGNWLIGETCHLYLQGQKINHARNFHEAGRKKSLPFEVLVLVMWLRLTITWVAPKHSWPLLGLLCAHDLVRTLQRPSRLRCSHYLLALITDELCSSRIFLPVHISLHMVLSERPIICRWCLRVKQPSNSHVTILHCWNDSAHLPDLIQWHNPDNRNIIITSLAIPIHPFALLSETGYLPVLCTNCHIWPRAAERKR
jgi:hypothetical protein